MRFPPALTKMTTTNDVVENFSLIPLVYRIARRRLSAISDRLGRRLDAWQRDAKPQC
jgi:hypothetical protein